MEDVEDLFVAVERAAGRKLQKKSPADCVLMQNGCYLLNRWGYGPAFTYDLYLFGPCSRILADTMQKRKRRLWRTSTTDIPEDAIKQLSEIIDRGADYLEAYTTLLVAQDDNPEASPEAVIRMAKEGVPSLEHSIMEASSSLF